MNDLPDALFRHWVHIEEEDTEDVKVYRPADRPLPPARGRNGIEFRPDGTYLAWGPGPADAPRPSEPRLWSRAGTDRLRLHDQEASRTSGAGGDAGGAAEIVVEVVGVDDDVLLLREARSM